MGAGARWGFLLYPCNLVGYARIVCYLIALALLDQPLYAALVFGLGHALDFFDGRLARAYGHVTRFGDYLDHVSDYAAIPLSFLLAPAYHDAFRVLVAVYCAFTIAEMLALGRHYKFVSTPEARPATAVLVRNNYANAYAVVFTYALMVEPLLRWGFASSLVSIGAASGVLLLISELYLGGWFLIRLYEGLGPFFAALGRRARGGGAPSEG